MKINLLFFLLLSLLFSTQITAQVTTKVKVLEVSASGKSLILDIGRDDGVVVNSFVKVINNDATLDKPNLKTLGTLESIKVYGNFSFWVFRKYKNISLIRKDELISIIDQDSFLKGRRAFKIKQKKIILRDNQTLVEYLKDEKRGIPKDIIQDKGVVGIEDGKAKNEIPREEDIENIKFEHWHDYAGPKYVKEFMQEVDRVFIKDPKKGFETAKLRERERKRVFESGVKEVLEKLSSHKNGLSDLYRQQKRDKENRWFKDKSGVRRYYDDYTHDFKSRRSVDLAVRKKVEAEGERFSEDFDRVELRKYMVNSGLAAERRRQELALDEKIAHEVVLRYDSSLSENTTSTDDGRNKGHNFNLGYEYQLGRFSNRLNRFTIDIAFIKGSHHTLINDFNARLDYSGYLFGANWYIYNNPYQLNSALWYIGTGFGRTNARIVHSSLEDNYTYSNVILPQWRLGMKYRFKSGDELDEILKVGVALNIQLSMESNSLLFSDQIVGDDELETSLDFNDTKLGFGISVYF